MKISQVSPNLFIKVPTQYELDLIKSVKDKMDLLDVSDVPTLEHVINQVLTLVKQEITNWEGDFGVLSLNGRSGTVELTATDLGAEPAFLKRAAFNRPFGHSALSICEGNDPRLEDERVPLAHVHEATDMRGLQNAIGMNEKVIELEGLSHRHTNTRILDLLVYNGTQQAINLGLLESIVDFSQSDIDLLKVHADDSNVHVTYEEKLAWDEKETSYGAQNKANQALDDAKSFAKTQTQQLQAALVSGATEDYATFKAIETHIKQTILPNLTGQGNSNWNAITAHVENKTLHLTQAQRESIETISLKSPLWHTHEAVRYKPFTTISDLFS